MQPSARYKQKNKRTHASKKFIYDHTYSSSIVELERCLLYKTRSGYKTSAYYYKTYSVP